MATKSTQTNGAKSASGKKMTAKQREARKRRKIIIFSFEIVILLAMVFLLYSVFKKDTKVVDIAEIDEGELEIDEVVAENPVMKGYWNIALFGVDATTDAGIYKGSLSDSIMIASINQDTGEIKLVSVYRDTYLNLGDDTYNKANTAYSRGGAEQAIRMLNSNLDMNITDFVTVGYRALSEVIDGLGGVWIDVDEVELKHINNYQYSIATDALKCSYTEVTKSGYQLLNGLQATAYCRIRYTAGDDFKRAARQREVLQAIEDQAKQADLGTLTKLYNKVAEYVFTSIDSKDIISLLGNIANYEIVDEGGFPEEHMRGTGNIGSKGSCVIPLDLESNVLWLHEFLFGEDEHYTEVSKKVKEFNAIIESDTAPYLQK
ncbi:LCP family protein [Lachnospiraceae bacterium OttesenSCG-928-D06]|nr:LCP family protein [Lachnospiraceae bacterium OttesenSCG-928-D06]